MRCWSGAEEERPQQQRRRAHEAGPPAVGAACQQRGACGVQARQQQLCRGVERAHDALSSPAKQDTAECLSVRKFIARGTANKLRKRWRHRAAGRCCCRGCLVDICTSFEQCAFLTKVDPKSPVRASALETRCSAVQTVRMPRCCKRPHAASLEHSQATAVHTCEARCRPGRLGCGDRGRLPRPGASKQNASMLLSWQWILACQHVGKSCTRPHLSTLQRSREDRSRPSRDRPGSMHEVATGCYTPQL